MSYPILYSATETNFEHNGIGILSACVSCEVIEEANGIFELAMQYPMDGIHYGYIVDRAIIKAKADQFRDTQLFRVYAISKPMNGIVTVLAEHISYDLSGIPVKPFSASSASDALAGLKNNAVVDCPFEFWTDKSTAAKFTVSAPASIRSRLGGVSGSILDVYGGQYEFDNYAVKLHNSRGMNRGVSIRYGKNLTDIQQEQNCSNVATGVYPYWVDSDGNNLVELPEKIINAPGTYNFVKIRTIDLSSEFETQPTVEQLRIKAERYINANEIGVPRVSLTVSFAQLEQHEEYKHLKLLERVGLFDTVNVEFPALGVSATAKAVKMVYDAIADRVKSVTLGSVRANIADTIVEQQKEIEKKPSVSIMQSIITNLTSSILGAKGGSVRILDANGDGEPDTLYIADNPDPALAVKVWRFNYEGWGASKNGYNGPFEMGATLEAGLLANFVTAAQLVAGTIKSQDDGKTFFLDLDNGILKMQATELSIAGKTVDEIAQEKADTAEGNAVGQAVDIAQGAVDAQTQQDIFNKLTNNGAAPGIFLKDGQLYINAAYLATGIISSADGTVQIDLNNNIVTVKTLNGSSPGKLVLSSDGLQGWGWDYAANDYVRTLILKAGDNGATVDGTTYADTFTSFTTWQGAAGLQIAPGKSTAVLVLGQNSAKTVLRGSEIEVSGPINPGKTLLWDNPTASGSFLVPDTDKYDLFAVQLGDGTNTFKETILAYKNGSTICGVGGWSGTADEYKTLHFVSFTFAEDTWTLEDCGYHYVYPGGGVSEGTKAQVHRIYGVI